MTLKDLVVNIQNFENDLVEVEVTLKGFVQGIMSFDVNGVEIEPSLTKLHFTFNSAFGQWFFKTFSDFSAELDSFKVGKNEDSCVIRRIANISINIHEPETKIMERLIQSVGGKEDPKPEETRLTGGKYTLRKLPDGKVWIMENLREKVEGAVWNEEYNCYMYTWEQAKQAVPKGYHLPSAREFMELCLACGYLDKNDEEVVKRLQDECGFVFSGYSDATNGSLHNQGTSGGGWWWSSTWSSANFAYGLYFSSSVVYPQYNGCKWRGGAVRCIKD